MQKLHKKYGTNPVQHFQFSQPLSAPSGLHSGSVAEASSSSVQSPQLSGYSTTLPLPSVPGSGYYYPVTSAFPQTMYPGHTGSASGYHFSSQKYPGHSLQKSSCISAHVGDNDLQSTSYPMETAATSTSVVSMGFGQSKEPNLCPLTTEWSGVSASAGDCTPLHDEKYSDEEN